MIYDFAIQQKHICKLKNNFYEIKKRIIFRIYKWNDLFRFGIWARKKQIH